MRIPRHVAIIPDGNRRWAKEKGLPTFEGHRKGFDQITKISKKARELGIKVLTFWGFSTENFGRTEEEKTYLWRLFSEAIKKYKDDALKEKIRIIHLGRKDRLPEKLIKEINDLINLTKDFNRYYLAIALDYGGRDEILRTIKKIKKKDFNIDNLDDKIFNRFLDTSFLPYPDPDLIIRTGGEQRLSGFMLWQSAYSELCFVNKFMPDFDEKDFLKCINEYSLRERRFGK